MAKDLIDKPLNFFNAWNRDFPYSGQALKPLWMVSFSLPKILNPAWARPPRVLMEEQSGYSERNKKDQLLGELDNSGSAFGPTRAWFGTGMGSNNFSQTTNPDWLYKSGNLFAFDVTIPGDSYGVTRKKIEGNGRGEAAGLVGTGRNDFDTLSIEFFEINSSFTESVIRPWLIYTAYNGLKIADVKTTIHIALLAIRNGNNKVRKSYAFHGAFPQTVGSETYDQTNGIIKRSVQFGYNWYSIQGWGN